MVSEAFIFILIPLFHVVCDSAASSLQALSLLLNVAVVPLRFALC